MAAVGNFQDKLTEENKAEFVAKLDNIVTGFALKVPVEKGGSILFSTLNVLNIKIVLNTIFVVILLYNCFFSNTTWK